MENSKRILLAVGISALILLGFNFFIPKPVKHSVEAPSSSPRNSLPVSPAGGESLQSESLPIESEQNVGVEQRLPIEGKAVRGSFNLRGARLDDLELNDYRETLAKDSPFVRLLDKAGSSKPSAVIIGWQNASGYKTKLPDAQSLWQADRENLTMQGHTTLSWDNGEGVTFLIHLMLDDHYMFTVTQEVKNNSPETISVIPFLRVQRDYLPEDQGSLTEYQGPIGVVNGRLADKSYKTVSKAAREAEDHVGWQATGQGGWGGITDKYWLTAIGAKAQNKVNVRYLYLSDGSDNPKRQSFRVVFAANEPQIIQPGASLAYASHVFAGAKILSLLQAYEKSLALPHFDKAIDFGYFSLLTRPILWILHKLYIHIGNFGLALMALTLIIKIILFPLASKAAVSAARMRLVAPKMQEIREKFKGDQMAMNQRIMALYKEEKINPAGGCLPILIQAPIFFCLYKMLNLSIDERHAPFFGWIKDLSVPDPTNFFNLFGLLPFEPTHYLSFLHLSIWGAALGITFWILQRQTMVSMDPAQARIMQFMPLIYVFVMSSFPAGLLIYYTWNNILTFLQQAFIQRKTTLPVSIKK